MNVEKLIENVITKYKSSNLYGLIEYAIGETNYNNKSIETLEAYMKNKKIIAIALITFLSFLPLSAEEAPMKGWYHEPNVQLNGKWFSFYSKSYNEQDGYAIVVGRKLHYWLYDTLSYHNGNSSEIYNRIIPKWVENMGYVIDYDNIYVSNPNTLLASSVRALMKQRGANISVALITDNEPNYVAINEYFPDKGYYKFTAYYLYR